MLANFVAYWLIKPRLAISCFNLGWGRRRGSASSGGLMIIGSAFCSLGTEES
jgi:hypothetical protein